MRSHTQKNTLKNGLNLIISLYINKEIYRGINIEIVLEEWNRGNKGSRGSRGSRGDRGNS